MRFIAVIRDRRKGVLLYGSVRGIRCGCTTTKFFFYYCLCYDLQSFNTSFPIFMRIHPLDNTKHGSLRTTIMMVSVFYRNLYGWPGTDFSTQFPVYDLLFCLKIFIGNFWTKFSILPTVSHLWVTPASPKNSPLSQGNPSVLRTCQAPTFDKKILLGSFYAHSSS